MDVVGENEALQQFFEGMILKRQALSAPGALSFFDESFIAPDSGAPNDKSVTFRGVSQLFWSSGA